MKNKVYYLSLVIVMAFLSAVPASAQGIYFGVKGGLNSTKMSIDLDGIDAKSRFGWFAGPTLKVDLLPFFGFQAGAFYEQLNCKIEDATVKQKNISIPVDVRLNLKFNPETGIYLTTGPQFAFNVGDDEFKWKKSSSYESTFQLKKSQFNWNFGVGAIVTKHLEVGWGYSIGLGKTGELKDLSEDDDPKSRSWNVSATLYF